MIIELNSTTQNTEYKIYELVDMESADAKTVSIKKLTRIVRKEDIEQRISQLTSEIARLEAEKKIEDNVLVEINKL